MITITLTNDENRTREVELSPDSEGYYRVELTWRYILKPGLVLDSILQAAGLVYIRRPPGEYFEYWGLVEKDSDNAYDHNGNITGES